MFLLEIEVNLSSDELLYWTRPPIKLDFWICFQVLD